MTLRVVGVYARQREPAYLHGVAAQLLRSCDKRLTIIWTLVLHPWFSCSPTRLCRQKAPDVQPDTPARPSAGTREASPKLGCKVSVDRRLWSRYRCSSQYLTTEHPGLSSNTHPPHNINNPRRLRYSRATSNMSGGEQRPSSMVYMGQCVRPMDGPGAGSTALSG